MDEAGEAPVVSPLSGDADDVTPSLSLSVSLSLSLSLSPRRGRPLGGGGRWAGLSPPGEIGEEEGATAAARGGGGGGGAWAGRGAIGVGVMARLPMRRGGERATGDNIN